MKTTLYTIIKTGLVLSLTSSLLQALDFTGKQISPGVWSYNLTFGVYENYSIGQQYTTITLTGLSGVLSASGPSSTSFPQGPLDTLNLEWTPTVLDKGTSVQWVHDGPGTGNFPGYMFVYDFRIYADTSATEGLATLTTDGFSTDTTHGLRDLDIQGTVNGPVSSIPEPSTYLLLGLGTLVGAVWQLRRRARRS